MAEEQLQALRSTDLAREDKIQILVPVYNEGENVKTLYKTLLAENVPFDVLTFVYDLDNDTSLPFIYEMQHADVRVSALKNEYGRGVLQALRYAFHHVVSGPVVVVMGDNSDKLSVIAQMVEYWRNGATVVCPSRYMPGGQQFGGGWLKSNLSRLAGKSLKWSGFPTADATNNFKLYDGEWLRSQSIESQGGFEIAIELVYKAFAEQKYIVELPTEWRDRTMGKSRFRLFHWLPHYLRWYFKALKLLMLKKLGIENRKRSESEFLSHQ